MGIATERFSDRKQGRSIDGNYTAQRGFDVIEFTDENDILGSFGIPQEGDQHPLQPALTCSSSVITDNKLTLARVISNYKINTIQAQNVEPLMRDPIIIWRWAKVSQPIDTDLQGNPILNSAGDSFKSNPSRNFSVRYLTISRWEAYYDIDQAETYTDTTNNSDITFAGQDIGAGQCYLISYAPLEAYTQTAPWVHVSYEFELRTPNAPDLTDAQIRYPFQLRILDQGTRAMWLNPSTTKNEIGPLFHSDGSPVCKDVLFNGNGIPLDPSIKVTAGLLPPIPNPQGLAPSGTIYNPLGFAQPIITDVVKNQAGTTIAVFLVYQQYAEVDFSSLGET